MDGWLHTDINVPHWELNPDTITHPSTNRARRRLTSLSETNTLPLCQTSAVCACVCVCSEESDVVNAVMYLLSDAAAMVNGTTLPVDGGFLTC